MSTKLQKKIGAFIRFVTIFSKIDAKPPYYYYIMLSVLCQVCVNMLQLCIVKVLRSTEVEVIDYDSNRL